MSDTLKSDLNGVISALLEAGLGLKSTHVAAVEKAIAELDRLKAEVKKPIPDLVKEAAFLVDRLESYERDLPEDEHYRDWYGHVAPSLSRLKTLLTTPDGVPSTEPVQAAGDAKQYGIFGNHTDRLTDYHVEVSLINSLVNEHLRHGLHDRDQLLARIDRAWLNVVQPEWVEVKNRLREIHSALIAPAETSDQGQDQSAPMNTETAEKPKPVSLKEAFARGNHMCCDFDDWANHYPEMFITRRELAILVSTLDQERGV